MKKIAQVGTFNVDNLGDLLFPIVFEKIVDDIYSHSNEAYEIRFFSPNCMQYTLTYTDQKQVEDIIQFDNYSFDKVFIGGGDLLRSDDWSINSLYEESRLSFSNIISPTDASIENCYTIGLGVPFQLDEGFSRYVRNSFARFKAVSVRDQRSSKFLSDVGIRSEIVPDLVLCISEYFPKSSLEATLDSLATDSQHVFKKGEYIVFQANENVISKEEVKDVAVLLNNISKSLGVPIVLISIGECLGDNELYDQLAPLLFDSCIINKENIPSLTLMDKVAILANAKGFIGSSLHGNIISYSYGIPHVTFSGEYSTKLTGFFELIQKSNYCLRKPVYMLDKAEYIVDYFKSELNNTHEFKDLSDRIFNFVKNALLDLSENKNASSYSKELDQLYKVEQAIINKKELEVSSLWKRVNVSENMLKETHAQNKALWERVNSTEAFLSKEREQIQKLWERVNQSESKNSELENNIRLAQGSIKQLNEKLENLQEQKNVLTDENERLLLIENEYKNVMSSFIYYLKHKKNKKGNL
ncbi:polysaccharide pyruvyl transferase family protein [Paenibacillus jamilae]|nr:polysaccharide pyruvyl transferase family protein [Paenibacillus jamilae]